MAKWDFKIVGASFVKELVPVADDVQPRSQSFMQPSFHLEGGKIVMKESGQYVTAIYFPQIGEIDGVAPTDIEDANAKLLTLVENFNGGGGTPQNLNQVLTEGNTSDQSIVLNNGTSETIIEPGATSIQNISTTAGVSLGETGVGIYTQEEGLGVEIHTDNVSETYIAQLPDKTGGTDETFAMLTDLISLQPLSGVTFTGVFSLARVGGTYYSAYTQTGNLTLSIAASPIAGGSAVVKLTANGNTITPDASWKNIGNDSISTVNGNVNRIIIFKEDSEIWYTVKVN